MSGGQLSPNTKLLNNPYGYNGEYHDLESGFQYLRARYYNPETARFITRDSYLGDVNEPLTLNRYAYTSNNPVMKIDPSGHINLEAGGGGSSSRTYSTSTSSSTATKAVSNNQPTLKKGSTDSNSVSKLQNMLRTIGYDIDVDGKFGEQTKRAVKDFQAKAKIGVDGVVGNQTWSSINTVYRNVESTGIPAGKITIPKGSSNSNSNSYIGSKMDLQLSYNKNGCGGEKITIFTRMDNFATGLKIAMDKANVLANDAIGDPVGTINAVGQAVVHLKDTAKAIENDLKDTYNQFVDGNGNDRFRLAGEAVGDIFLGGEVGKALKTSKVIALEKTPKILLPDVIFTTKKLQHEFKHAGDFGITGNWNKATGEAYQKAIQNHIDTANDVYKSTYRGDDVYVYMNKNTSLGAYTDLSGNYVGGWKFNSDQINFHITNGIKIK